MMKKRIIALLVVIGAIAFTGCGGTNSLSSTQSTVPIETKSGTDTETVEVSQDTKKDSLYEGYVDIDDGLYFITAYNGSEKDIVVPDTIEGKQVGHIGAEVFRDCDCKSITLPDTVKEIEMRAFVGCTMGSISLGKGLKTVGSTAFSNCDNLVKLEFPEGFERLDALAIYECGKLEEVYLPSSVIFDTDEIFMGSCENAVVVTPAGSAADTFARDKGYEVRNA